jgi:cytochrome P450
MRSAFAEAVLLAIDALKPSFMFVPALRRRFLGLSAWSRFLRTRERIKSLFAKELAARRASTDERSDILSLLLQARYDDGTSLSDEELLDQMMNLIGAGHETTASSLAWAFYFIHRDPAIKERLLKEVNSLAGPFDPEAVVHLPYLEAVCSETLRINPVAPLIGRVLVKPLSLLGYELPPGIAVGVGILLCHRRADLYPQPDHFRPERFLQRTYTPFEYLPFGGGARRCIGAAFAMYEFQLVLYSILKRYSLRLVERGPVRSVVRNTTAGPGKGIRMIVE